jgi:hypothetical protein
VGRAHEDEFEEGEDLEEFDDINELEMFETSKVVVIVTGCCRLYVFVSVPVLEDFFTAVAVNVASQDGVVTGSDADGLRSLVLSKEESI